MVGLARRGTAEPFDRKPPSPSTPASKPASTKVADSGAALAKEIRLRRGPTRIFGGIEPAGWRDSTFDDRDWTQASGLVVPRAGAASASDFPPQVTATDVVSGGSLYVRVRFDAEDLPAARSLELRITYRDGLIGYLNGREIVRRNVPLAPPGARPMVAHGEDPEHIFLPLRARDAPRLQAKGNILAIEVRPAAGRAPLDENAPSAEVGLAAFSAVRIVRGPYLVAPGDGAVSVAWETDLPARGRVRLEPVDGVTRAARFTPAPRVGLRQVVRLTDLAPGARYRYQVDIEGAATADRAQSVPASIQTAPRRDQPLRFAVYGDMRAPGHAAHAQVVAGLLREKPALVINTGDLVAVGQEESAWQRYFEITAPLGAIAPVVPALGNHEAYLGGAPKSWALFGLQTAATAPGVGYTSFEWGGAHFIILDSNHPEAAQRDWLEHDLAQARARRARAIFAICHDGPWSHGTHGGSRAMERQFTPLLAAGGTDVLFSGHDHLFERGVGVTPRGSLPYVVTGGGGAPLYNPTCQPSAPPAAAGAAITDETPGTISKSSPARSCTPRMRPFPGIPPPSPS